MNFKNSQKGASLTETAILIAIIAVVSVTSLKTVGNNSSKIFDCLTQAIDTKEGESNPCLPTQGTVSEDTGCGTNGVDCI